MGMRRRYYDGFSRFYDAFVRLHSRDRGESMRGFLVEEARLEPGSVVVDLCTGTGSAALRMAGAAGVRLLGVDFSRGMLRRAARKTRAGNSCFWVQADARRLPIRSASVDRVTCAYAMYELTPGARGQVLREVVRVLKPGGMFLLMEHEVPASPVARFLYFLRIRVLGRKGGASFAGVEERQLGFLFYRVSSSSAPGGRTKVVIGQTARPVGGA